jgi:TolA-binding protein
MSLERDVLDDGVRAFRGATALPTDGRATRSRVLAAAGRGQSVARHVRRTSVGVAAAIIIVLSGAAAWTAVGRWRAGAATSDDAKAVSAPPATGAETPRSAIAERVVAAPSSSAPDAPDEERLYARAHEAHFVGSDPAPALAAWNLYLRRYPRGAFVPEARYNRALTLLRLGRVEAAIAALRPFAAGAFGAYRRDEATTLLTAVAGRNAERDPAFR